MLCPHVHGTKNKHGLEDLMGCLVMHEKGLSENRANPLPEECLNYDENNMGMQCECDKTHLNNSMSRKKMKIRNVI